MLCVCRVNMRELLARRGRKEGSRRPGQVGILAEAAAKICRMWSNLGGRCGVGRFLNVP